MENMAQVVHDTFMDCLFKDGEPHDNFVKAEGITCTVGFHPGRLEEKRKTIEVLLDELPEGFHEGWSFLQACMDREGNQWGEHRSMEQLFQLGIAIGEVDLLMPRELWSALPGGMPYYKVKVRV